MTDHDTSIGNKRNIKKPNGQFAVLAVILLMVSFGFFWANFQFANNNPGGNDFIPRWIGTREFIREGLSPYSDETTEKIQEYFYDRPAQGDEDRQLFIYPLYSMLVFAPFSLAEDFVLARALWMTFLEAAVVASVWISFLLVKRKPKLFVAGGLLVFWLVGYHGARPIINGNASIVVGLFIVLTLLAIQEGWDRTAGGFLALSTIKPQMVILVIPLILIWALSRKRIGIVISFGVSMIVLIGGSMLFQPDWLIREIIQILQYPNYTEPGTPVQIFSIWWSSTGRTIGIVMSLLAVLVLVIEWAVSWGKGFAWLLWTVCLTMTLTNWTGIPTTTANFIGLIPASVLIFTAWETRGGEKMWQGGLIVLAVLLIGLWTLFLLTVEVGAGDQPIQSPILFFPFPLAVLAGLYWIRWWVTRPREAIQ